jgi:hypothetical protein
MAFNAAKAWVGRSGGKACFPDDYARIAKDRNLSNHLQILKELKSQIGPERYSEWESRAKSGFDADGAASDSSGKEKCDGAASDGGQSDTTASARDHHSLESESIKVQNAMEELIEKHRGQPLLSLIRGARIKPCAHLINKEKHVKCVAGTCRHECCYEPILRICSHLTNKHPKCIVDDCKHQCCQKHDWLNPRSEAAIKTCQRGTRV